MSGKTQIEIVGKHAEDLAAGLIDQVDQATRDALTPLFGESSVPGKLPILPVPARKRSKRAWQPTERERAILSLPHGRKLMREYCQSLDTKGVPFPEKWQKKGWPKNHVDAWDSKDDRLRNNLESERNNAWTRMKKG